MYELEIPGQMVKNAADVIKENPELSRVLTSPVVPMGSKHAVIEKVFREPEYSGLMVRFLKKACDAGCIGQMGDIADAWQSYSLRMEGVMEAELHYVTMPGAAQIAGMKQFLCSRYHKKDIDLRLVMQPDLVGGFVLKAGDTEYDYSLKGQLNQLCRAVVR
ncbi:ATP synthase F1 subunit delta [Enterocloster citroniae]|uniref:ATP synthase F1 subunit delta n=1 Tax=Enterocloster citroniae TaxID=358743 RepID=UPI001FABF980|nr:ATP synthase F1 subunit delta [Enterocloster citroniae]